MGACLGKPQEASSPRGEAVKKVPSRKAASSGKQDRGQAQDRAAQTQHSHSEATSASQGASSQGALSQGTSSQGTSSHGASSQGGAHTQAGSSQAPGHQSHVSQAPHHGHQAQAQAQGAPAHTPGAHQSQDSKASPNPVPVPVPGRPAIGEIVIKNPFPELVDKDIGASYVLGRELGRGEFGVTFLATDRRTGEQLACKSIPKRKLRTAIDVEDVRREVAIMHHLPSHPNIVGLRGVFEDRQAVHLVQELCEGGELFERIIARGHYSERQAAGITRTIVEVVDVCHKNGVMHRDLKPENFLFASQQEDSPLRAIDFGLSIMFRPGERFSEIVGSPYYMAPEVLRKDYGPQADVWSAGVILYILLCGVPPFWAETEQGVAQAVLKGQVDFLRDPWPKVSDSAKHLVMLLLDTDASRRPTAEQVLQHPWLRDVQQAPDTPLGEVVFSRMKQFTTMNKLKKKALLVIADSLQEEEVYGLQEVFKIIDTDCSGTISLEELRVGLHKFGSLLNDDEVKALMEAADLDGNGMIDYQEWVAATMHLQRVNNEKNMRIAFNHFDSDNSGYIDIEELADALGADLNVLKEILAEVDTNNDGKISWEEFVQMMRAGTEFRTTSRHFSKSRSSLRTLLINSNVEPPPQ